jgi:tight adherence protein B
VTGCGWAALAAAVALAGPRPGATDRAGALAGGGRLGAGAPLATVGTAARVPWTTAGGAGLAVAVATVFLTAGPALGLAAGAVAATAATVAADLRGHRAANHLEAERLGAVALLTEELTAGGRPATALAAAAAVAPRLDRTLRRAAAAAAGGDGAADVLCADPATRTVGVAWRVSEHTGAPLADVLRRVTADLTAAADQRRAVTVALAGPRASAALLAGLPVLGLALGSAMGARPLGFLTGPDAGRVVCAVGVGLDMLGVLWIRRILDRAQRR